MTNTRRDFLLKGAKTAGLIGVFGATGCSAFMRQVPEGHVAGAQFYDVTNKDIRYRLQRQVIFGLEEYFRSLRTPIEGALPLGITPVEKTQISLGLESGEMELILGETYVPRRVKGESLDSDEWRDIIRLRKDYNPNTGMGGVKARIPSLDELREKHGISRDDYLVGISTTERDNEFTLPNAARGIAGRKYLFIAVEEEKRGEDGKRPYYMIPIDEKDGSEARIIIDQSTGTVFVRNDNDIYRPTLVEGAQPVTLRGFGEALASESKNSKK